MIDTNPAFEVADIISAHGHELLADGKLHAQQKKVFTNLVKCRTIDMGFHKDKCDNPNCNHTHISYNSCRDRHCPKCNGLKREQWVGEREKDLLPVKYYHVVFTVPDKVNHLFLKNSVLLFNLLFRSAWETVNTFGHDYKHLGAQTGMTCILHTWGQNLTFHPHLHCLVPAGGITKNGKWRHTKNKGKYLFPVKALSSVFRGKFTDGLIKLDKKGVISLPQKFIENKKYLHPYYKESWVVYAKLPMHNARQVVNYIGRYSHRIAISNHRIKTFDKGQITFSYFNYRTSKAGSIELRAKDFLQRFALHILPPGFMKIRHYGILSSKNKNGCIALVRKELENVHTGQQDNSVKRCKSRISYRICPVCKKGQMVVIEIHRPKNKGSPVYWVPGYPFSSQ
jgi:hypothetical protein